MKFVSLGEEEFRAFLCTHPLKSFLQMPEIGKLRKSNGWHTDYVGVKQNGKIIAGCMLLSRVTFKGKKEFYTPRGPLMDYHDATLFHFFFDQLKQYIDQNHGYILRIDPYIIKQQRDIDGKIVENGIDNRDIISALENIGFIKNPQHEQVRWMFVLDLENKTEEDILKEMKRNTRNYIRKGEKVGIHLRDLKREELGEFKKITEDTSKRIGFVDKPLSYYQDMYDLLAPRNEIRYVLAELNLTKYITNIKEEIEIDEANLAEIKDQHSKQGVKKTLEINIDNAKKRLEEAKKIKEQYGEVISLSAGMFICNCDEIIYLFSGNYDEFMQYNAQYVIQWKMIQYALKKGFKRYNFYGISGNFDEHSSEYGVYLFKKGFNGHVEELIGEFELPIDKYYYKFKRKEHFKSTIKKLLGR